MRRNPAYCTRLENAAEVFRYRQLNQGANDVSNVITLFADDKGKRPVDAVQHQRQTIQSFLEHLDYAQKCFMDLAQRHDAWVSELRGAARLAANAHAEDTQGRTYSFLRDLENFEEELCEAANLAGRVPANVGWREEQLPAEEQEALRATKPLPVWIAMDGGHFKDANGNYLIKSHYSDTAQLGYYRVLRNVAEGRWLASARSQPSTRPKRVPR